MISTKPIIINPLFYKLNSNLIGLLSDTPEDKWQSPTICEGWCVKDIVGHILKDYILLISRKRDKYRNPEIVDKRFGKDEELVKFIAELNQGWVDTFKTLSPRMLIELLNFSGPKLFEYFETVDLMKVEAGVSWISSEKLPNWMDVAREYTEHWLHQTHIREALDEPLLDSPELFNPFISTYLLAVPKTFKNTVADVGTTLEIKVMGEAGGTWYLERVENEWNLTDVTNRKPVTVVEIDQDILWRLFSKGVSKENISNKVKIVGDNTLGQLLLNTVSLIA